MSEKQVEEVEAALDMLLWIKKIYIKATLVASLLVSLPGAVISYLLHMRAAALFFVFFGAAVTWLSGPVVICMLVTETWLVLKGAQLRGGLTRVDAAVIATNVIYTVILFVLSLVLTIRILSLKPASIRVE
jgi:hypothetical protein